MAPITHGGAAARRPVHHHRPNRWPFKALLPDATTVAEQGVGVPRRQEVEFADGSRIWLQRVEHQGVPELFMRELGAPATGLQVDLRHLVPELAQDLPRAATRDVPGIVHYSLRGRFGSVEALLEAAVHGGRP